MLPRKIRLQYWRSCARFLHCIRNFFAFSCRAVHRRVALLSVWGICSRWSTRYRQTRMIACVEAYGTPLFIVGHHLQTKHKDLADWLYIAVHLVWLHCFFVTALPGMCFLGVSIHRNPSWPSFPRGRNPFWNGHHWIWSAHALQIAKGHTSK